MGHFGLNVLDARGCGVLSGLIVIIKEIGGAC